MSDKVEIKNCPFCGGEATLEKQYKPENQTDRQWEYWVECHGPETDDCQGFQGSQYAYYCADQCTTLWNTRHLTPAQAHGDELYAELEKVEWAGTDDKGYKFCLMCERYHPEFDYVDGLDLGHAPNCTLNAALKLARGETP